MAYHPASDIADLYLHRISVTSIEMADSTPCLTRANRAASSTFAFSMRVHHGIGAE